MDDTERQDQSTHEAPEEEAPPTPEEFEEDPARNPEEEELRDIKGG